MTAISTIVLNDAQATPAVHNFVPARQGLAGAYGQIAEFEDRSANGGIPVGFNRVSLDFSRPQPQRKSYRLKMKLELPVLEVTSNSTVTGIAPAPTVAYRLIGTLDVVIPERASLQSRKDLRKYLKDLLIENQVLQTIENLDFPI